MYVLFVIESMTSSFANWSLIETINLIEDAASKMS